MKTSSSLECEQAFLDSLPLWTGEPDFNLDVPRALCDGLGNPQDRIKTIHVTGTNGKGSVSAMLASILHASGYRVGQFASPHLSSVNQRCLLGGRPVPIERFLRSIATVRRLAEGLSISPSYFEYVTAASFLVFAEEEIDWAVIEVGLGGRLDATNVLRHPKACVITGVAYDHMQLLGETLPKIAREKALIAKSGSPMFVANVGRDCRDVIQEVALENDAPVYFFGRDLISLDDGINIISTSTKVGIDWERFALWGEHQKGNARLAGAVASFLGISEEAINQGLRQVRWPGRLELVELADLDSSGSANKVLFDVAHNPDGLTVLLDYLKHEWSNVSGPLVIVFSVLDRKDWGTMLKQLSEFSSWYQLEKDASPIFIFTTCHNERAVPAHELEAAYTGESLVEDDPVQSLKLAREIAGDSGLVLVTGSIFLVGEIRPTLVNSEFRTIAD